jgi:hypothetical protein
LYFWRTVNGSEVDLVIRRNGRLDAFEIKWSAQRTKGAGVLFSQYGVKVHLLNRDRVDRISEHMPLEWGSG